MLKKKFKLFGAALALSAMTLAGCSGSGETGGSSSGDSNGGGGESVSVVLKTLSNPILEVCRSGCQGCRGRIWCRCNCCWTCCRIRSYPTGQYA
ncbi:hypothetical protein [Metabacillus endolithicus]|uniref:hypothetical protein n=1 Tax=Metabacillus endolithicus TaxID=1535204 RepID=UPI001FFAC9A1|nr:hypothetical protein [Metabacillus endolithicus]UPG61960.1 hypothetical protein MVE64_15295 [Metabacillus endolithicus]